MIIGASKNNVNNKSNKDMLWMKIKILRKKKWNKILDLKTQIIKTKLTILNTSHNKISNIHKTQINRTFKTQILIITLIFQTLWYINNCNNNSSYNNKYISKISSFNNNYNSLSHNSSYNIRKYSKKNNKFRIFR